MLAWSLLACRHPSEKGPGHHHHDGSDGGSHPAGVGAPSVTFPRGVELAAEYAIDSDEPTTLTLQVEGPEESRRIAFPETSTHHRVPVLGNHAATTYQVSATLTGPSGVVEVDPIAVRFGSLPDGLPGMRVPLQDRARMEPGYTMLPPVLDDSGWIVAVDADGEPVYVQSTSPDVLAVSFTPDGDLAMVDDTALRIRTVLGEDVVRWTSTPTDPADVEVPFSDFHHEIVPRPDGTVWALSYEHVDVPDYPQSYDDPGQLGPATIRNDIVLHLARDGTVLQRLATLDLFDHHHIGFDSLEPAPSGALDWVHVNAIQYDADTDELTISLRHQDAVARLDATTGALKWIFGSPYGWAPEFQPLLLTATEAFTWPTHQHGIQIDPDGTLRMFDNGNDRRNTPYHGSGQADLFSRILTVRVDEDGRTVTPVSQITDTTRGGLYCGAYGNADRLPTTGNVLGTWGPAGLVTEHDPDGDEVWELKLEDGWRIDRAIRVPSLYPPGVEVSETRR